MNFVFSDSTAMMMFLYGVDKVTNLTKVMPG